ncbi:hypothetical protein K490DRAFT_68134 [Saccharata proteae CBS 121410]|uniref:Uncharacterized protein n=1 Tax=Saccharata proteae CBS 121410 TaxID=1314787 RepID=A0A9P4HQQ2_9PEZI|nr:hypothetical protein K490DRAFT_68134 [Saccharata proteae CBS 121410]
MTPSAQRMSRPRSTGRILSRGMKTTLTEENLASNNKISSGEDMENGRKRKLSPEDESAFSESSRDSDIWEMGGADLHAQYQKHRRTKNVNNAQRLARKKRRMEGSPEPNGDEDLVLLGERPAPAWVKFEHPDWLAAYCQRMAQSDVSDPATAGTFSTPITIPDSDGEEDDESGASGKHVNDLGLKAGEGLGASLGARPEQNNNHIHGVRRKMPWILDDDSEQGPPAKKPRRAVNLDSPHGPNRYATKIEDFFHATNNKTSLPTPNDEQLSARSWSPKYASDDLDSNGDKVVESIEPNDGHNRSLSLKRKEYIPPVTIYVSNSSFTVPLSALVDRDSWTAKITGDADKELFIDDPAWRSITATPYLHALPDVAEFLKTGSYGAKLLTVGRVPLMLDGVVTDDEKEENLMGSMLAMGMAHDLKLWDMAELSANKILALRRWNPAHLIMIAKLAFSREATGFQWEEDFREAILNELAERYEELREANNEEMRGLMDLFEHVAMGVYSRLLDGMEDRARQREGNERWVNEHPPRSRR